MYVGYKSTFQKVTVQIKDMNLGKETLILDEGNESQRHATTHP